ncbi:MAG: 50S ribosomal protein L6, partial [Myxococcales bacterium]|nr:50S ribosomal protein L6 [Myxococcales bacterium]
AVEGSEVVVSAGGARNERAAHGLARTLVQNMVDGVSQGFERELVIEGVGYRVELKKDFLIFNLGYSHAIWYELPEGISATVDGTTKVKIAGPDKERLGQAAATIRGFRPPEPYKGKGIRYADEVIRRKAGKAGA